MDARGHRIKLQVLKCPTVCTAVPQLVVRLEGEVLCGSREGGLGFQRKRQKSRVCLHRIWVQFAF